MFKFLHAADVHLDSPLRGLERYDGAPVDQIRQAPRQALKNLVQLALDERVDFVLLAGDLYDGDWQDFSTGLYFISQMVRLREAQIPVFLIAGNHDAANRMTRSLKLPDNVALLSADQPETRVLEPLGVAIHGQGFANAAVWDDLSARYPHARRGYFNVGLLHTSATGADGHERYAPCTLEGLRFKNYDYWALGHVHQRQVLHEQPPIVFPGNVQGRHAREVGPKGCYLATVQDGRRPAIEFRRLDVLCWETCEISSDLETGEALLDRAGERLAELRTMSEGRPLAVRVVFSGASAAHEQFQADPQRWANEVRGRALQVGAETIWVEKVKFHTATRRTVALSDGPIEELLGAIEGIGSDETQLRELGDCLADLTGKLPRELTQGADGLDLNDPACLRRVLDQVRSVLVSRLLSREAP